MGLGGKKADEGRVRRSSPRVMIPGGDYKPTDVAYLQPCTVHWKFHYKSMSAPLTSSMQAGPASVESYVSWGIYIRVPLQFSRFPFFSSHLHTNTSAEVLLFLVLCLEICALIDTKQDDIHHHNREQNG
jgi:hypothetical protein